MMVDGWMNLKAIHSLQEPSAGGPSFFYLLCSKKHDSVFKVYSSIHPSVGNDETGSRTTQRTKFSLSTKGFKMTTFMIFFSYFGSFLFLTIVTNAWCWWRDTLARAWRIGRKLGWSKVWEVNFVEMASKGLWRAFERRWGDDSFCRSDVGGRRISSPPLGTATDAHRHRHLPSPTLAAPDVFRP